MVDEREPLEPVYDVDAPTTHVTTVPARLSILDEPRQTAMAFDWSRYRLIFEQPGSVYEVLSAFDDEPSLVLSEGVGAPALIEDHDPIRGVVGMPLSAGDEASVGRIRFHVVNLPDHTLPGVTARGRHGGVRRCLTVGGGRWELRIDRRHSTGQLERELRHGRRYAVTHIGELSRVDGAAFDSGEVEDSLGAVQMLLSFVRGNFVALALPVGYDSSGAAVWWEVGERFVTAGMGRGVSWLSKVDAGGLEQVAARWLNQWQGPLWPEVLQRATVYYLEANRQSDGTPGFLDLKVVAAQSGFELLAWTLFEGAPQPDLPEGRTDRAADRMRRLLEWAGIPVPESLSALDVYAAANGCDDLVHGLTWIRDTVIHPQMRDGDFGHPHEVLQQAWQAFTWMLELMMLRVLGYDGWYGSRLELGRKEGATEPVPWRAE